MILFTLELIIRFIVIGENKSYQGLKGRLKYLKEAFTIIDLIVLIPYYLTFIGLDLMFLRALRAFRLFKLLRYEEYGFDMTLLHIIRENKDKFIIVLQLSTLFVLTCAPIMYQLEHEAQPNIFKDMLDSLWWTIITFTTVGYGDMYPITGLGKIFGTFVSVIGISFYAIPGAILTTALLEKLKLKDCER
jgi:voltage-gated potassium channel